MYHNNLKESCVMFLPYLTKEDHLKDTKYYTVRREAAALDMSSVIVIDDSLLHVYTCLCALSNKQSM